MSLTMREQHEQAFVSHESQTQMQLDRAKEVQDQTIRDCDEKLKQVRFERDEAQRLQK